MAVMGLAGVLRVKKVRTTVSRKAVAAGARERAELTARARQTEGGVVRAQKVDERDQRADKLGKGRCECRTEKPQRKDIDEQKISTMFVSPAQTVTRRPKCGFSAVARKL